MDTTKDSTRMNIWKKVAILLFVATWIFLCINSISQYLDEAFVFGPIDVSRRVSAPKGNLTAILVRSYASLDLNFALYISDRVMADVTSKFEKASFIADERLAGMQNTDIWIRRALWISNDYNPATDRNWNEDIEWSRDGSIVAVIIQEQYAFAYDFDANRRYEDADQIRELLALHGN